jgi:serine beta-lactamase-like protein LACTB, mitochondrial
VTRLNFTRRSLLLGSAALPATAYALSSAKSQIAAARRIVQELLAADPIPALSIAAMRHGELVWSEAFGMADVELAVIATTAHRFRLGSVSKIITATLAAQLASKGLVDLDAPISQAIPDLPAQHHATTLRQLLTHRGGIRHYADKDFALDAPGPIDRRQYLSTTDVLAVFINDSLVAPPGEQVSYSTFGYTLASLVLEAATKTPFLDLVNREITVPLALESLTADAPASIVLRRVSGYQTGKIQRNVLPAFEGKWANIAQNNPAYKWAGGGFLATPADLARFGAAHLTPGRLSKAALDALFTVYTQRTDRSPPLGLGWRIDSDDRGRKRWHHAGGQDGARASLVVYPDDGLAIAFATNITGMPGDVNGPSASIADAFTEKS